jgi:hypothetical protein
MSARQKRPKTAVDQYLSILFLETANFRRQLYELNKLRYRVRQAELSARNRAQAHSLSRAAGGSSEVMETCPGGRRKACKWRAFAIRASVSGLLNCPTARPICRKSPAIVANIPVFGRHQQVTGFEMHCVAGEAVQQPLLTEPLYGY